MTKDTWNYLLGMIAGAGLTEVTAYGLHQLFREKDIKDGMQCGMFAMYDYLSDATAYASHGQYCSDEIKIGLNQAVGEYDADHKGILWNKAQQNYDRLKTTGDCVPKNN